jgi:hypothetical protein
MLMASAAWISAWKESGLAASVLAKTDMTKRLWRVSAATLQAAVLIARADIGATSFAEAKRAAWADGRAQTHDTRLWLRSLAR